MLFMCEIPHKYNYKIISRGKGSSKIWKLVNNFCTWYHQDNRSHSTKPFDNIIALINLKYFGWIDICFICGFVINKKSWRFCWQIPTHLIDFKECFILHLKLLILILSSTLSFVISSVVMWHDTINIYINLWILTNTSIYIIKL